MTIEGGDSCDNESQSETSHSLPNILYIMGTARSGTTILEILLSNNHGITGIGEVTHIFQDGYIKNATCSCGEPVSTCKIWSDIKKQCHWNDGIVNKYSKLFEKVSWHTQFPRVALGWLSKPLREAYKSANDCLFKTVSKLTDSAFIIDSSKYAGRALELARLYPNNVKVICLTRTPEGLVNAFLKKDSGEQAPKSLLGIFLYYIYTMACFRVVMFILGKRVLPVQFEDLTSSPDKILKKIEAWSCADLSQVQKIVNDNQWLEIGHIVTGNRLRMSGRLQFRSGVSRKQKHGFLARTVILFMSAYKLILGF